MLFFIFLKKIFFDIFSKWYLLDKNCFLGEKLLEKNEINNFEIVKPFYFVEKKRFLETHPAVLEGWIREKASAELRMWLQGTSLAPKTSTSSQHQEENTLNRNKRNSVTSDLFQSWLASNSPVKRSRSPSRYTTIFF